MIMFRTIFFYTILWISLIISLLFLPVIWGLNFTGNKKTLKRFIRTSTALWAEFLLIISGIKVVSEKRINIPATSFVIVSNHQGYFDIPVLIKTLPVTPAFIAKIELKKIPLLNLWMEALDCLFINRSDSIGSRRKIMQRLQEKNSNPLLLFPEGTRSRSSSLLPFRTGGLKMVYENGTNVLPVKIRNTWKCWEAGNRIRPGEVIIKVYPVIETTGYPNFEDFIKDIHEKLS